MSKSKIIAVAGAFALTALASAASGRPAMADTPPPSCHRVNPYVACTYGLKLKTQSQERATYNPFHFNKLVDRSSPIHHPVRRLQGH